MIGRLKRSGFVSIGGVVLLTVLGVVLTAAAHHWHTAFREWQGHLIGKEMARLNDAVQDFVMRFPNEIKALGTRADFIELPSPVLRIYPQKTASSWTFDSDSLNAITQYVRMAGAPNADGYALLLHFSQGGESTRVGCDGNNAHHCSIETMLYRKEGLHRGVNTPDVVKMQAALRTLGPGGAASGAQVADGFLIRPDGSPPQNIPLHNPVPGTAGILTVRGKLSGQDRPFLHVKHGYMAGHLDLQRYNVEDGKRIQLKQGVAMAPDGIAFSGAASKFGFDSDLVNIGDPEADDASRHSKPPNVKIAERIIDAQRITVATINTPHLVVGLQRDRYSHCDANTLAVSSNGEILYCSGNLWRTLHGRNGERHTERGARGIRGPRGEAGPDYDE